jgi:carbamoyl-phosphate synthase large subunit
MPRRTDIKKILLVGSGPIVIGQACEFDYSGTQGAKALVELGYDVVLVNSNPATIMTDPELVRRTYIEPIDKESLTAIIQRERPDALLPTLGGQTALNAALELHDSGILSKFGVQLIGAQVDAIRRAEDRELFKQAMARAGLESARSGHAHSLEEAREIVKETGFPAILRRASRSAAPAARWSKIRRSSTRRYAGRCRSRQPAKCWSKRACWAGKSSNSK